jgi:glycosyltransferase involved in cell wall biosynthesis
LAKISGIPWVADFRDSMTEETFPRDPAKHMAYERIEQKAVYNASRVVFTAPGALAMYAERYPDIDTSRFAVIENGFDEAKFRSVEERSAESIESESDSERALTLVHSGLLYPSERDPTSFFLAIKKLVDSGRVPRSRLRIVLRASGYEDQYRRVIDEARISDIVKLEPSVPYGAALNEMLRADGLLLFQAANCNHQIPAKLYEYIRAKRPILALTDPDGDTAGILERAGVKTIARIDRDEEIAEMLASFVQSPAASIVDQDFVASCSRHARTRQLATLLDNLPSGKSPN